MSHWWEIPSEDQPMVVRPRAVAYYRHSAQDRQENSIPIQREQVREWAEKNGVEIIEEFEDAGKSGLNAEGRPAFTAMMNDWVKQRNDFQLVLCLDVSRWGRFQDIDLSAQYSAECSQHGKQVVYTTIGMARKNDNFQPVYIQFERFRAAQYSKELSAEGLARLRQDRRAGLLGGRRPALRPRSVAVGRTPGTGTRARTGPAEEHSEPAGHVGHGRTGPRGRDPADLSRVRRLGPFGVSHCRTAQHRRDPFGQRPPLDVPAWSSIACGTRSMPARSSTTGRARSSKRPATPIRPKSGCGRRRPSRGSSSPSSSPRPRRSSPSGGGSTCRRRCSHSCDLLHSGMACWRPSLVRLLEDAPSPATFAHRFGGLGPCLPAVLPRAPGPGPALVHEQICQQVPEVLALRRLPRARRAADRLGPTGRADSPRLRDLLALSPRPAQCHRHHAGRAFVRSRRVRDPRLRRAATLDGRLATAAYRSHLVADRIIRTL